MTVGDLQHRNAHNDSPVMEQDSIHSAIDLQPQKHKTTRDKIQTMISHNQSVRSQRNNKSVT